MTRPRTPPARPTLRQALEAALNAAQQTADVDPADCVSPGVSGAALPHPTIRAAGRTATGVDAEVELEVEAVGPIGVRVRSLRVRRGAAGGDGSHTVEAEAAALPARLAHVLPEPVVVIEADAERACLRTPASHMSGGRFFDIDLRSDGQRRLRRVQVAPDGSRSGAPWSLTRDGLGRLTDALAGPARPPPP